MGTSSVNLPSCASTSQVDQGSCQLRDRGSVGRGVKMQQISKSDSSNSSSVHPVRALEDENLDYDSNASSSSFEFHKGERSVHNPISRSLLRPMSSKWNDAEKWIMNRQGLQGNHHSKNSSQSQTNRLVNGVRVVPDASTLIKRVDSYQPALPQMGSDKFSFGSFGPQAILGQPSQRNGVIDLCPESKESQEVNNTDLCCDESFREDVAGVPTVAMRDMGTEMTPVPSLEPSMTSSPIGATTPIRSPSSSIPSTPRRAPASTPLVDEESQNQPEKGRVELSEQEMKLNTRKEILALGVQLGKRNIAAWASKEEKEGNVLVADTIALEDALRIEFEEIATAWEDAEKSKHNARFKREEIKIQAWESQQKAKLEAEMRGKEVQVVQIRARAQAKLAKKITMARQRSEEKRAAAEARKNRQAEKTAARAEHIRQTGRIPSSSFICCGWS